MPRKQSDLFIHYAEISRSYKFPGIFPGKFPHLNSNARPDIVTKSRMCI